jgi:uncharacterized protein (DUF1778 family)
MDGVERRLSIRVPERELELWKEAAWVRKVSLSEWTRSVLSATAAQTLERAKEKGLST